MAKRHVMITVEDYIHDQAKARGINLSAICEDAIRQILNTFEHPSTELKQCKHNWTFPFSTPMGLYKECKRCGLFKRVIMEGSKEEKELLAGIKIFPEQLKALKSGDPNPEFH